MNFVTHFNFYVFPEKLDIKYFDTANDTVVDLEYWRKINKGLKAY